MNKVLYASSPLQLVKEAQEPIIQQGRDCAIGGGYFQDNPHPPETLNHRLWKRGMEEQLELQAKVRLNLRLKTRVRKS